MPRLNASNNFSTTLAQNITDTDTSFDVTDASDAPATPFVMTIRTGDPANGEIIEVGSVSSNTFSSVSRGQEGTTAQSWSSGDTIEQLGTAGMYNELDAGTLDIDDSTLNYTASTIQAYIQALDDVAIVDDNLDVASPANGYYVQWDNGLMVCWNKLIGNTNFSI